MSLKLTNACKFGFRKQVSIHVLKSELAGERMCGAFIVAREQPGRQAGGLHEAHRFGRVFLDRVGHRKDRHDPEEVA